MKRKLRTLLVSPEIQCDNSFPSPSAIALGSGGAVSHSELGSAAVAYDQGHTITYEKFGRIIYYKACGVFSNICDCIFVFMNCLMQKKWIFTWNKHSSSHTTRLPNAFYTARKNFTKKYFLAAESFARNSQVCRLLLRTKYGLFVAYLGPGHKLKPVSTPELGNVVILKSITKGDWSFLTGFDLEVSKQIKDENLGLEGGNLHSHALAWSNSKGKVSTSFDA